VKRALVLFALAACGRSAPAPRAYVVKVHAMQFDPAELHVHPGDTITWENGDLVAHTETGAPFNGFTDAGKSWTATAPAPGTYPYACTLHPMMKAVVIVDPR
jgi:plastocyanin